jgi:hypothetical protein
MGDLWGEFFLGEFFLGEFFLGEFFVFGDNLMCLWGPL